MHLGRPTKMMGRNGAQPFLRQDFRLRRRELMLLVGAAITAAHPLRAEQKAMPLVAYLRPTTSEVHTGAFRRGLRELGYVEGQNIALEVRSAEGDNRRLPALAAELVALKPDVIVTNSEPAIRAAKEAAGTIPIVMAVCRKASGGNGFDKYGCPAPSYSMMRSS